MADTERAGPCIGVLAGRNGYVFDVGSGSVRKLARMGFPMPELRSVYLTHLHSDHIDGLGELMLQAWIAGARSEPLPIVGPVGTAEVVGGFNAAYRIDSGYRVAHHGPEIANPDGYGAMADEVTLPAGPLAMQTLFEGDDVRISVIRVEHSPVEPAFGYRVDYKDRLITISGDTIYHPGFVAASEGVDLMLHEALDPEMVNQMADGFEARGAMRGATIFHDILDYHASPEDAARSAAEAGVDELVIYHIVPPLPSPLLEPIFLGDAPDLFDGPVTVGHDGMLFSLPAGSDRIERSTGF